MNLEKEIFEISLVDIIPNRFQPREMFDDNALQELAQSIKEHGVIQPIIVRKVGDKYEIIAGERRFRASQLAGKTTVPALVRDIDDKEAAKIALLENLQRSNLTPIEEAKTYQTILKLDNITQEELAQNLGKSQSTIANKLRLLTLDEEVQTALLNSQISERHARSLLSLDYQRQGELLHRIINEKLTVRQVDEEIMKMTGKMPEESNQSEVVPNAQEGRISMNIAQNPVVSSSFNNHTPQEMSQVENQIVSPVPVINPGTAQEPITNQMPNNEVVEMSQINPVVNPQNIVTPPVVEPVNQESNNPVNNIGENTTPNEIPNITEGEQVTEAPTPKVIQNPVDNMEMPKENIFEKLRINAATEEPVNNEQTSVEAPKVINTPTIINSETEENQEENYGNIYDLRFAINNFRQAIQNTEKFGFKVTANEYDSENKYQIVIEIEKKN